MPKLDIEVFTAPKVVKESIVNFGATKRKVIPQSRRIGDTPYHHMQAAIKYQGIRLHFFAAMFRQINVAEFTSFLQQSPQSKYNRVLWFLYKWLTGHELATPALTTGNYISLFADDYYYTLQNGLKDKRTRVINNAIGTKEYCPTVRKTSSIRKLANIDVYKTAYAKIVTSTLPST